MKFKDFLKKKNVEITAKAYFLDALGAMAFGLFASLLIGTIFTTLGEKLGLPILIEIASFAKQATGAAIGVAIAYSLHAPSLVLFSSTVAGIAGNALGGPVGAYVASVISTELGKIVSKETKIDILITPSVVVISGVLLAMFVGPGINAFMEAFGRFIENATELHPFIMGIVVSVSVGMALTLPISSAALCITIGLSGIAAGAATAGCCAQMVGFAVMSFRENRWGGFISQGIGTSMLQMPNIIKNPLIWIPPTLSAAITGPISTCLFQLENVPIGAGMGTCGLVGPFGIITAMPEGGTKMWLGILLICFVLPAILTWIFGEIFRKLNWIKENDLLIKA
ncbi:MAG: PTS sugar transporter subunit IIC [Lentimicrobiaceae bacterium]|nr:PTS sugar transporter subunit IIC [Lentimicrobiaceae bacterium]